MKILVSKNIHFIESKLILRDSLKAHTNFLNLKQKMNMLLCTTKVVGAKQSTELQERQRSDYEKLIKEFDHNCVQFYNNCGNSALKNKNEEIFTFLSLQVICRDMRGLFGETMLHDMASLLSKAWIDAIKSLKRRLKYFETRKQISMPERLTHSIIFFSGHY